MNLRIIAALVATALLVPLGAPLAQAASFSTPHEDWIQSARYSNEGDDDFRSYYRERYSSTVTKAIRKLDDDKVEHFPIPVLFVTYKSIYSDFGDPRDGGAREHEGQDILAPRNSFIVSPTDAVVTKVGKATSAGTYVYTANPGGETFRYMHLDHVATGVKAGKVLQPGDLIGYVGNTGNAAGGPTHLHFEVRDGREATDPYPRMTGTFTQEELINSLTSIVAALKKELD